MALAFVWLGNFAREAEFMFDFVAIFLPFVQEIKDAKEVIAFILLLGGGFFVYKRNILQDLFGGYQKMAVLREAERDQAYRDKDVALAKVKELEDYIKLLMLNEKMRMEVELQIRRGDK